jgi:hypothetical protein
MRGRGAYSVEKTIAKSVAQSMRNEKRDRAIEHLTKKGLIAPSEVEKIRGLARWGATKPVYTVETSNVDGYGAYNLNNLASVAGAFNPLLGSAIRASGRLLPSHAKRVRGMASNAEDWGIGMGAYRRRRYRGRGAYIGENMSGNNLMGGHISRDFSSSGDETNGICITHKEYLQDLTPTTTAFQTLYSAYINPGLAASFPWLSQIAQYFEEYEFIQLIYQTESMITEGNTNAAGTIICVTQYNPTNPLFTSKEAMQQYEHSQSYKVTQHAVHGIECDPEKMSGTAAKYVRTSTTSTAQDQKTYDLGVFQLATQNCFANLNLGELWVTYKVILRKAKIPVLGSQPSLPICQATWVQGTGVAGTFLGEWFGTGAALNEVVPFNSSNPVRALALYSRDLTNPNALGTGGFTLSYTGLGRYLITFPTSVEQGIYQVDISMVPTAASVVTSFFTQVFNGTVLGQTGTTSGSATRITGILKVQVDAPGALRCGVEFQNPNTANAAAINNQGNFIKVCQCNPLDSTTFA